MENKIYLKDEELEELFKNRIIQHNSYNSNSELFQYGDIIFKIYNGENESTSFNKCVINNIFNKYSHLNIIDELILPEKILIYNMHTVGFSMPFIEGTLLEEIISKDLNYNMKKIFLNLLNVINKFDELPFEFCIGDMHEKNIIIDSNNNVKIIDPDSFIIDNNKLCINKKYLVGKYANYYFNNFELKKVKSFIDYYSLLCIILNYSFKGIIEDVLDPITWLRNNSQFKDIHSILFRVDENFILNEEDIDIILDLKNNINYKFTKKHDAHKDIKRVRKLLKENSKYYSFITE